VIVVLPFLVMQGMNYSIAFAANCPGCLLCVFVVVIVVAGCQESTAAVASWRVLSCCRQKGRLSFVKEEKERLIKCRSLPLWLGLIASHKVRLSQCDDGEHLSFNLS